MTRLKLVVAALCSAQFLALAQQPTTGLSEHAITPNFKDLYDNVNHLRLEDIAGRKTLFKIVLDKLNSSDQLSPKERLFILKVVDIRLDLVIADFNAMIKKQQEAEHSEIEFQKKLATYIQALTLEKARLQEERRRVVESQLNQNAPLP